MKDVTKMRVMTRFEEIDRANKEIAQSVQQLPVGGFIVGLIERVYRPFVHAIVHKKHDAIEGRETAMSVEAVKIDVAWVMSNMAIEMARHMVPGDDLGAQFEFMQSLVARIATNLQEDLNERAVDKAARKPGSAH